jgi:hypothetical protein
MKKTKDLLVDLDMIYDNLLLAEEDADNPILKSKIKGISKQLFNLINHLDDLIQNPPPDLQQHKKMDNNSPQADYYNPNKKKKVHYKSQGRNARIVSKTHTKEGKLKV